MFVQLISYGLNVFVHLPIQQVKFQNLRVIGACKLLGVEIDDTETWI